MNAVDHNKEDMERGLIWVSDINQEAHRQEHMVEENS